MNLQWNDVDSSFVERVAYDNEGHDLYIDLNHGLYVYNGVPETVFERFLESSSKGKFFSTNIKEVYTYTQIR